MARESVSRVPEWLGWFLDCLECWVEGERKNDVLQPAGTRTSYYWTGGLQDVLLMLSHSPFGPGQSSL